MAKRRCDIRIGTSGWHYDHWLGRFYPEKLPKDKWLEYYAERFDTVEINNTFYHLPKPQTFHRWRDLAPKNFLYAVKANRYITHIKRLKDTADEIKRFFDAVRLLKETLGPILFQLPPGLHKDLDLPGRQSPRIVTADTIYIRFHGTTGRYSGSYSDVELQAWADWIKLQSKTASRIYAYFNNDAQAHAIKNAQTLKELLSR